MRRFLFLAALLLLLSWPLQAQDVVSQDAIGGDAVPSAIADIAPTHAADVQAQPDAGGDVVLAAIAPVEAEPVLPGPTDGLEIGPAFQALIDATKDGAPLGIVSAAIFLLLCIFRNRAAKAFLNRFLPTRWLSVVAVALGVLWAVLTQVDVLGWWGALSQGLLAGGGAVAIYEVLVRAVANKDGRERAE